MATPSRWCPVGCRCHIVREVRIAVQRWDLRQQLGSGHPGLGMQVSGGARSPLAVQVATPELLRVRQSGATLISARIESGSYGVRWVRHRGFSPVVAPIRFAEAERLGSDLMRWAHHFASALAGSTVGPLARGRWVLRPVRLEGLGEAKRSLRPTPDGPSLQPLSRAWGRLAYWEPDVGWDADDGYIDWGAAGSAVVLPLRHPSPARGASRPQAYHKLARAGTLPPVLLWWVSGLGCWLVIDGHDRLTAALAVDVIPPMLGLERLGRRGFEGSDSQAANRYRQEVEKADARGHVTTALTDALGVGLSNTLATEYLGARTVGEPIPGGAAEWYREARNLTPRWQPAWTD